MPPSRHALRLVRLALLGMGLLVTGCDNPFCVYGPNGCQQDAGAGTGGLGSLPAAIPADGDTIQDGPPTVLATFPSGNQGTPGSVVVLVMSESLDASSLLGAFELRNPTFGTNIPILQPPLLTGGGRVVVLVPANPFTAGQAVVIGLTEDAEVADLTGQPLSVDSNGVIEDFAITAAPAAPQVVTVFPSGSSQSELSQIVVVFDRAMDPMTITSSSFVVDVTPGGPPANPQPQRLSIPGAFPIPVNQVWTWRATGPGGAPLSLGLDVDVELVLSPGGAGGVIEDGEGEPLAMRTFEFGTALIGAPRAVRKSTTSMPVDAIGRPNLTGGQPVLEVELASAAQDGDELSVFFVGSGTNNRIALQRRVTLSAGQMVVELTGDDLDLLTVGGLGRFLDGDLYVAARHGRGSLRSAVRVLDADSALAGVQPLLFDVTPPVLQGFGPNAGSASTYRSDHRGIVITGRADEEIAQTIVTTNSLGDTGTRPDAVASGSDGTFVAKPVSNPAPLDVIDPADLPQPFSIRLVDRAGNESAPVNGSFIQTGVVGGGAAIPGPRLLVDVYDATTLAPIAGALVMSQQDNGGTVTDRSSVLTDASGHAEPLSAVTGETIVIVDRAGYGLFTFHGPTTQRIQIPLTPSVLPTAAFSGQVLGAPGVNFSTDTTEVADSRRSQIIDRFLATQSCTGDSLTGLTCTFGPNQVRPRRLGAQAFFATRPNQTVAGFTASGYLRANALRFPAPYLGTGQVDVSVLSVSTLLSDLPDQPLAFPPRELSLAAAVNLGTLDGSPSVSVEGIAPGFPGSIPVGRGLLLDEGTPMLFGAYPASVPNELVDRGAIDGDLIVRVEAKDDSGNRVGRRRRLSDGTGTMSPPDVPELLAPAPGAGSGFLPYELCVRNVIRDAGGQGGIYHVLLRDFQGRAWDLWRPDPPDAAGDVRIHVSDLSGFGRAGLANGSIVAQVSAHAWTDYSTDEFLWTDVERIADQYGLAAGVSFTQP